MLLPDMILCGKGLCYAGTAALAVLPLQYALQFMISLERNFKILKFYRYKLTSLSNKMQRFELVQFLTTNTARWGLETDSVFRRIRYKKSKKRGASTHRDGRLEHL